MVARKLFSFWVLFLCALYLQSSAFAFGRKRDVRTRITQQVDKALGAVKASKAQREQVKAALADVLRTADDAFGGPHGMVPEMDEVLAMFASDHIDPKAIAELKLHRNARHKAIADALEQAFAGVHRALSQDQRARLADYARGQVQGKHMRAFKEKVIDGFVYAMVEDVLDQVGATEDERRAAHTARDRILATVKEARDSRAPSMDELARLFTSETVDKAGIAKFRAAQEERMRVLGDTVGGILVDLHDSFSAAHRQKLVEIVRAQQAHTVSAPAESAPL